MLNPDTPTLWLISRLKAHAPLVALLDGKHFYKSGEAEDGVAAYIVIKPPPVIDTQFFIEKYPVTGSGRYWVWAECRSDLINGASFDEVLTPLHLALQNALLGQSMAAPQLLDDNGAPVGFMHSCEFKGFYTPLAQPLTPNSDVKVGQKGVVFDVIFS